MVGASGYTLVAVLRTSLALRRWSRERLCTDPRLVETSLEDCKRDTGLTAPHRVGGHRGGRHARHPGLAASAHPVACRAGHYPFARTTARRPVSRTGALPPPRRAHQLAFHARVYVAPGSIPPPISPFVAGPPFLRGSRRRGRHRRPAPTLPASPTAKRSCTSSNKPILTPHPTRHWPSSNPSVNSKNAST